MKRKSYFVIMGLSLLCAAALLGGCSKIVLLDPKGPIGGAERYLIIMAFVLMLIVVIPVFVMVFWFSLRYRASNTKAAYTPKWDYSAKLDWLVWLVPIAIVTVLAYLAWTRTFQLDPYKPIDAGIKPIHIQVVSLDWNWLFIYPDQDVASVNQLVFPANAPVSFRLTSDTVMTSFFIPQLGSQMYAMAGMQTRLHLMADEPGVYAGQNQEFSGRGYEHMYFQAIATSPEQFQAWVEKVKQSPDKLDLVRYGQLRKPTVGGPVTYFSWVKPGLFDHILRTYMGWMGNKAAMGRMGATEGGSPPISKASGTPGTGPRVVEEG
jgi:cytochrome o ubiquinol oxidase subunit 2